MVYNNVNVHNVTYTYITYVNIHNIHNVLYVRQEHNMAQALIEEYDQAKAAYDEELAFAYSSAGNNRLPEAQATLVARSRLREKRKLRDPDTIRWELRFKLAELGGSDVV